MFYSNYVLLYLVVWAIIIVMAVLILLLATNKSTKVAKTVESLVWRFVSANIVLYSLSVLLIVLASIFVL